MATTAAASYTWLTATISASSTSKVLPGGASFITIQNRDGSDSIFVRFGPPGTTTTTSDFKIAAGASENFQFSKPGQHQYVHLLADPGNADVVILVDSVASK